jgi:tellurite resistance protein TehA-like permease
MGTGIVSILIHQLPYQFTGLSEISVVFLFINIILFITLFVLNIVRYALWPEIWGLMLRHPVQSLFLYPPEKWSDFRGAMPMGLATIITMLVYVAIPLSSGFLYFTQVLFWIDVVFSLLSCFGVPLYMYAPQDFIDKGSWLINIRLTS